MFYYTASLNDMKESIQKLTDKMECLQLGQEEMIADIKRIQLGQEEMIVDIKRIQLGQDEVKVDLKNVQLGQDEVKVDLKNVQFGQDEVKVDLKNVRFDLDELRKRSQLSSQYNVSASKTDHGAAIHNNLLLASPPNITVAPEEEGPAVILPELLDAVKVEYRKTRRPHEKVLITLYTPSLIEVLNEINPDLRLVNSECYQWLHCMSGYHKADLKPDLFSAHHSLVEFLPAYNGAPVCAVPRVFGRFINWQSRASIHCIWDAKWKIDMAAFGEMCKYLQIASENAVDFNGVAMKLKGVLFDIEEFWMIRSSGSTIIDVVKCKWTQCGSKHLLKNFLCAVDAWQIASHALCDVLNVTIEDFSGSNQKQSAFLGAGANGRVFKLTGGAVMKIVLGKRSKEVGREFQLMKQYQDRIDIQSFVFPVVKKSFRRGTVRGVTYAGYLLAQEGVKLKRPLSHEIKVQLAASLYGLHSCGVIHGDARIDNALMLGGTLKWIDFREIEFVTTDISIRGDVQILLESLGGSLPDAENEIEAYMNEPTLQRLETVLLSGTFF